MRKRHFIVENLWQKYQICLIIPRETHGLCNTECVASPPCYQVRGFPAELSGNFFSKARPNFFFTKARPTGWRRDVIREQGRLQLKVPIMQPGPVL